MCRMCLTLQQILKTWFEFHSLKTREKNTSSHPFFTIFGHEEKDMVFGTEFVNEIQQKCMVFGMESVQEFGNNSDNNFFKGYNRWKSYRQNCFRSPGKFLYLRTSKFTWSSETECPDVRNDKDRETVIKKATQFS